MPNGTVVPTRGLGIEAGAQVYVLRFGGVSLGVGASWLGARGTTSPPEVTPTGTSTSTTTTTTTATTTGIPNVTTRVTSVAPQLSLNFGHSLGWSYVSAGLGSSKTTSEASLPGSTSTFAPADSGWVKTINFGGGARWYFSDHLGFGFDLRWHKVSLVPASNTHPGAPRASLLVAGAGVVLK